MFTVVVVHDSGAAAPATAAACSNKPTLAECINDTFISPDPHIRDHNGKFMNIGKPSAKFWHQKARSKLDSGSAGFFDIAGKATKELAGVSAVAAPEVEEKEYPSEEDSISRSSLAKRPAGPWHDASPKAAKTIPDFEQPPYCGQTTMKEPVVKDLRNRMKDETLISTHKAVEIDTRFPGLSTLEHPVGYSAEICPLEGWMMIKFVQSPLPPKKESKKELVPKIHMSDILMYQWKKVTTQTLNPPINNNNSHPPNPTPSLTKIHIFEVREHKSQMLLRKLFPAGRARSSSSRGPTLTARGIDLHLHDYVKDPKSFEGAAFHAFLQTPLIRAVAFMLNDYPHELGYKRIAAIKIRPEKEGSVNHHIQLELEEYEPNGGGGGGGGVRDGEKGGEDVSGDVSGDSSGGSSDGSSSSGGGGDSVKKKEKKKGGRVKSWYKDAVGKIRGSDR